MHHWAWGTGVGYLGGWIGLGRVERVGRASIVRIKGLVGDRKRDVLGMERIRIVVHLAKLTRTEYLSTGSTND